MTNSKEKTERRQSASKLQRLKAIALMCGAVSVFSVLDTLAKYLSTKAGLPIMQIIWVRFTGNILLNLAMFGPLVLVAALKTPHRLTHLVRTFCMAATTGLNFLALQYLQLDQTVTMSFIAPLFVAALGGPLLGEWIGWQRFMAIVVGFSGVLFVTRPGFGGVHYAIIYSFGAALTYALYNLATRYIARIEAPQLMQITAPLAGFVIFMPAALSQWVWPRDLLTGGLLLLIGFIGGFGHWLLVLAHRHAPAPILAPFTYVGLPSMIVLGWMLFGDLPSWWTLLGAMIIMLAGGYLLWREK